MSIVDEAKQGLTQEECLVCDRVGTEEYYRELRQAGFTSDEALMALKNLASIYFADNSLLAGRKRAVIKATLAYLSSQGKRTVSELNHIFGSSDESVRTLSRKICFNLPNIFPATKFFPHSNYFHGVHHKLNQERLKFRRQAWMKSDERSTEIK